MNESLLSLELIDAYRETHFHVQMENNFILKIDHQSTELLTWHAKFQVNSSAFITAHNPFGKRLTAEENAIKNRQLKTLIEAKYDHVVDGFGQDPLGEWPGEDSFLIYGISLEEARSVGNLYEQNAIVWSDKDAIPQLVLLR